jgi:hypothetical protein
MGLDDVTEYFIQHLHNVHSSQQSILLRTFSKIDHILGHKASLSKYMKTEIIHGILSDHNVLKLGLNNQNNSRKYTDN